jgi:hypothetical protein
MMTRQFGMSSLTRVCLILLLIYAVMTFITPDKAEAAGVTITVEKARLYPVSANQNGGIKWGYIDSTGKTVIRLVYTYARDFQDNGLAVIEIDEAFGLIDTKGNCVVKPRYFYIGDFSEGLAVASDVYGCKIINQKGSLVFKLNNSYIGSFHEGLACYYINTASGNPLFGYINGSGKVIIQPKYQEAGDFKNGKALVKLSVGKYAFIGKDGKFIRIFNYDITDAKEGMLIYKDKKTQKLGYMNEYGKVIIKAKFTEAWPFQYGFAVVSSSSSSADKKYGLIDKKGSYKLAPVYNEIISLGEGMIAAGIPIDKKAPYQGLKYAIANNTGRAITGYIFYNVDLYKNGLSSVSDANQTYFLNRLGQKVKTLPVLNGRGEIAFIGNLIRANVENRTIYLNSNSKIIWKENKDITLDNGCIIKENKYRLNMNTLVYYPQLVLADKNIQDQINRILRNLTIASNVTGEGDSSAQYTGEYEFSFSHKDLLVLKLTGYSYSFGAAHGMPSQEYIHINLNNGTIYKLSDLFKKGSNYLQVLSDLVREQIEAQEYSDIMLESYTGISENQGFSLNGDSLQIYFNPYEIAPYAAGFPTFSIPYKDIMDIVDTSGGLWNSFIAF